MVQAVFKSLAVSAILFSATPMASADPESDARYIVEATLTEDYLNVVMGAMAGMMGDSMTAEFARGGVRLSDDAGQTMVNMMMPTMLEIMLEGMGDELVAVYLDEMSPASLKAYREFLQTTAGQEVISSLPAISAASADVGERLGQSMGMQAAGVMMLNIQTGNFPDGTSEAVKSELSALFE
ncbi:MAG: DUF2059 domain-containing protein [Pseudomonadota bacterium]